VKDYAILMLDLKGRVTTWNAGTEHIKGYTAEGIIGQPFSIFYTREDAASGKPERDLEVAAKEGRAEDEGWRVRKDGSRFWANVIITAINDKDGRPIGYSQVTRDLTDRKRAEETLRQSEERARLMVEGVKDYAILMLDLKGRVTTWNAGTERIKGYSAQEIIGQPFSIFYTSEDAASGKPERDLEAAAKSRFDLS
jgi:PAS domain S-box-containing protein